MQPLATAEQMQRFDRAAITKYGIPGSLLMENAGRAFVEELSKRFGPLAGKYVTVVCGKGNNGGDGFVIARHLLNQQSFVSVALLCKRRDVGGDAKVNFEILRRLLPLYKNSLRVVEVSSVSDLKRLRGGEVVVDAIFGTGFRGRVDGIQQQAIQWINQQKCVVGAVDIASGVDSSTGVVVGEAVHANFTVTMGMAKVGQFVGRGRDHSGDVVVADISIPREILDNGKIGTYVVEASDVRSVLPKRIRTAHKYSVGKVLVLAGSRRFTGAPLMTAQAAMRGGAGAVVLATPSSIHPILARRMAEVLMIPLAETSEGSISMEAYEAIHERVHWADAVAIGPGLSRNAETMDLVRRLIPEIDRPLVVDADALFALSKELRLLSRRESETILTPHAGELAELIQQSAPMIELERVEVARSAAKKFRSILCLKGSPTATATGDGSVFLNPTGNPGMATIGAGDVLTGLIASLTAQGMAAGTSAYAGAFIHGLAGDIAARRLGEQSLMAMDILHDIAEAIKAVEAT